MKPVCVQCRRFFRVKQNGFYITEMMPKERDALPGNAQPEKWQPYKVWAADLYECPDCGTQIVSGFGNGPINEHYKPDFIEQREALGADQLNVNDC